MKELADDNFKFRENGRKFCKWIEKAVEKGKIAINFSFCHSVFKRVIQQTRKNQRLFGKGLNIYHTITTLEEKKPFENIVGKGENAGNQHFVLPPQCSLLYERHLMF